MTQENTERIGKITNIKPFFQNELSEEPLHMRSSGCCTEMHLIVSILKNYEEVKKLW